MDINIVSLLNSKNRELIKNQLDNKGIRFYFFDAVFGENDQKGFNSNLAEYKYNRKIRNGEIGCSLSHFRIINKYAVRDDFSWGIILEDDALIQENFKEMLNIDDFKCFNDEPCVFILGHSKTRKKDLIIQRLKQPLENKIKIGNNSYGQNNRINFCGTVGYVLNKKACEIIGKQKNVYWLADDWFFFNKLGINIYHPLIPSIYEDLTSESSTDNIIFFNHCLRNRPIKQIFSIVKSQTLFLINKLRSI